MAAGEIATRPYWVMRAWAADAGAGRNSGAAPPAPGAGSVPGHLHLDLCAALLVEEYGKVWFERGAMSLYFRNAIADGERVQAACEVPHDGRQVALWVRRDDALEVAEGTASLGDHGASALRTRDLRPVPPDELRILRGLVPGQRIGEWHQELAGSRQQARYADGAINDPLSWYADSSPWGGPIATPSTAVELLTGEPMRSLTRALGEAVGVFGAIEVAHHAGPLLLGERYRLSAEVVALSDSPRAESLWFDACAHRDGELIAGERIMLRFLKASSPHYPELA